ncbi:MULTISPECIES: transposase [Chryseobacterium]|uniref:Transposase n=1 Tax=Chryseobacterium endophyticum TaxID=1854762 RepID=A0AAU6WVK5_9FLAO|nr:transposase [uncultured Chryseobacterium sp.]
MENDFKDIHIGKMIRMTVEMRGISEERIYRFIPCTSKELQEIYRSSDIKVSMLLRWSKLLGYDFFRLYSQHLILYAPAEKTINNTEKKFVGAISIPQFRKNIYTREVIYFILEQIRNGQKTKIQIMEEYSIPKTTLYKWLQKYRKVSE